MTGELKIIKQIPTSITFAEIVRVLKEFYDECEMYIDKDGFITQTLERIALATFLNNGAWDLWVCEDNGEIKSYFLCSVDKAGDNKLCYYIHQGWICKDYRTNGFLRGYWEQAKIRAKEKLCGQMMIYSIRSYEAYKRILGDNLKPYAELLHLKLEV